MSIEIPDWVVQLAVEEVTRVPPESDNQWFSRDIKEVMTEALRAALEGWLVPVYQIRTVAHRTWTEFKPTHYEHILDDNDDGFYEGRILYDLRKDKTP